VEDYSSTILSANELDSRLDSQPTLNKLPKRAVQLARTLVQTICPKGIQFISESMKEGSSTAVSQTSAEPFFKKFIHGGNAGEIHAGVS
jgi:hypothetical protein